MRSEREIALEIARIVQEKIRYHREDNNLKEAWCDGYLMALIWVLEGEDKKAEAE